MKVKFKVGFRYDAEETFIENNITKEEIEKRIAKESQTMWDDIKKMIDFEFIDDSGSSILSEKTFDYEIDEGDGK